MKPLLFAALICSKRTVIRNDLNPLPHDFIRARAEFVCDNTGSSSLNRLESPYIKVSPTLQNKNSVFLWGAGKWKIIR